MRSHHWTRLWLGTVRQQAITSANVDSDLFHYMASLSRSELKQPITSQIAKTLWSISIRHWSHTKVLIQWSINVDQKVIGIWDDLFIKNTQNNKPIACPEEPGQDDWMYFVSSKDCCFNWGSASTITMWYTLMLHWSCYNAKLLCF